MPAVIKYMIIGIDASNIRYGGGVTYLSELLNRTNPQRHKFKKIVIFGHNVLLKRIKNKKYLAKYKIPVISNHKNPFFDRRSINRAIWAWRNLPKLLKKYSCNLLFLPGAIKFYPFQPYVTISRNMLPFSMPYLKKVSFTTKIKLFVLKMLQQASFAKADHIIFLTEFARSEITKSVKISSEKTSIIPHGISQRYFRIKQKSVGLYKNKKNLLVYISTFDYYKNQLNVAQAVAELASEGFPLRLYLIGNPTRLGLVQIKTIKQRFSKIVKIFPSLGFHRLKRIYRKAFLKVFASSVENMPNILLEAMASKTPVCCSRKRPMTDILGDDGYYFDPESVDSIKEAILHWIHNPKELIKKTEAAYQKAKSYCWQKTTDSTFAIFNQTYQKYTKCFPMRSEKMRSAQKKINNANS